MISAEYTITDLNKLIYNFAFDYLKKKYVKVSSKNITTGVVTNYTYGVHYVVVDKTIELLQSVGAVGDVLRIVRETSTSEQIVSWNDASILKASDMSLAQLQQLHILEEYGEYISTATLALDINGQYDAKNSRIVNLSAPQTATDAVNRGYIDSFIGTLTDAQSWAIGDIINRPEGSSKYWSEQSKKYVEDYNGFVQNAVVEATGYGIIRGGNVTVSNMTATVNELVAHMPDGKRYERAQTTITIQTADATKPRIDLIYLSDAGAVTYLAGTALSTPTAPTLPNGGLSLATISVSKNATTGTATDTRVFKVRYQNTGIVNVKDFGAVGDGIADDTDAIQKAIDSISCSTYADYVAQNFGGGTVIIPRGWYRITKPIYLNPNVRLIGTGSTHWSHGYVVDSDNIQGTTIFADFAQGATKRAIIASGWNTTTSERTEKIVITGGEALNAYTCCDNVRIEHLTILSSSSTIGQVGIVGLGTTSIVIEDVNVYGFYYAVILSASWGGAMRDFKSYTYLAGVCIMDNCQAFHLDNCYINMINSSIAYNSSSKIIATFAGDENPYDKTGVYVVSSSGTVIQNTIMEFWARGIAAYNTQALGILGYYTEGITDVTIDLYKGNAGTFNIANSVFGNSNTYQLHHHTCIGTINNINWYSGAFVNPNATGTISIEGAEKYYYLKYMSNVRVPRMDKYMNIIYVDSVMGDDTNYGVLSDYPVKTIATALSRAQSSPYQAVSIYLKGTQDYPISGDTTVSKNITFYNYGDVTSGYPSIVFSGTTRVYYIWLNPDTDSSLTFHQIKIKTNGTAFSTQWGMFSPSNVHAIYFDRCTITLDTNVALLVGYGNAVGFVTVTFNQTTVNAGTAGSGYIAHAGTSKGLALIALKDTTSTLTTLGIHTNIATILSTL